MHPFPYPFGNHLTQLGREKSSIIDKMIEGVCSYLGVTFCLQVLFLLHDSGDGCHLASILLDDPLLAK